MSCHRREKPLHPSKFTLLAPKFPAEKEQSKRSMIIELPMRLVQKYVHYFQLDL